MRTIPFRPSLRFVLISGAAFLAIASCLGWMALQNRQYADRLEAAEQALVQQVMAAQLQKPTITDARDAIVAKRSPGIVTEVRMKHFTSQSFVADVRRMEQSRESVDAPGLWTAHHRALMNGIRLTLVAVMAQDAQLAFVDRYLGDSPSLMQIKSLPNDPEYLALTRVSSKAASTADAAAKVAADAVPSIASLLPWTPDLSYATSFRMRGTMESNLRLASTCAAAELAGTPAPATDCARLVHAPAAE